MTYARIAQFNKLTMPSVSKDTKQGETGKNVNWNNYFAKTVTISAMTVLSPNDSSMYRQDINVKDPEPENNSRLGN